MSAFTYRDASNRVMTASSPTFTDAVVVVVSDVASAAVRIANADVPAVALELLKAAGHPALAELVEKAEAEAAGKRLQERRDALATKFLGFNVGYHSLEPSASLRPAIDYALELEDKLEAAK